MSKARHNDSGSTQAVLELDDVHFDRQSETSIRMAGFSATLHAGQLVKATLSRHHDPREIVSMMIGLVMPRSGTIRFA